MVGGALRLAGEHEKHHSKDRILVTVWSGAGANFRGEIIIKLPRWQALVVTVRAAQMGVLSRAGCDEDGDGMQCERVLRAFPPGKS